MCINLKRHFTAEQDRGLVTATKLISRFAVNTSLVVLLIGCLGDCTSTRCHELSSTFQEKSICDLKRESTEFRFCFHFML
jgi:hypothetical protein